MFKYEVAKQNNRIVEVDIAKGLGILLVLVGHSLPKGSELHLWIGSFHMSLFFMLSGLVMKIPNAITYTAFYRKTVKLIVEYFFWSSIYFAFDIIVRVGVFHIYSLNDIARIGYQIITFYGVNVLWFLYNGLIN